MTRLITDNGTKFISNAAEQWTLLLPSYLLYKLTPLHVNYSSSPIPFCRHPKSHFSQTQHRTTTNFAVTNNRKETPWCHSSDFLCSNGGTKWHAKMCRLPRHKHFWWWCSIVRTIAVEPGWRFSQLLLPYVIGQSPSHIKPKHGPLEKAQYLSMQLSHMVSINTYWSYQ